MGTESMEGMAALHAVGIFKGGERIRSRITFPGSIRRNGNSYMVTVPVQYLAKLGLEDGADVDVTISLPPDTERKD